MNGCGEGQVKSRVRKRKAGIEKFGRDFELTAVSFDAGFQQTGCAEFRADRFAVVVLFLELKRRRQADRFQVTKASEARDQVGCDSFGEQACQSRAVRPGFSISIELFQNL